MEHWLTMVFFAALILCVGVVIALNTGSEFVPKLSEGAITINVVRLAGTDLDESIHNNTQMEKTILQKFPDEVSHVWSRIGTAEVATDPMGVELTDVFISLKPRDQWRVRNERGQRVATQAELTKLIENQVRDLPGQKISFTQPIAMRIDEMVSGVKAEVAVKVFGDDLNVMKTKAQEVAQVLQTIDGNADVNVEQVAGQPVLRVQVKPEMLARYGLSAKAVLELVESVGSKPLGEVVEGQLRFPLVVRLPDNDRASKETIEALPVTTPSGEQIPLSRLAKVEILQGPPTITREWGQRRITVTCNVRDRDMGSFVAEAQQKVRGKVAMPSDRYRVEWGGQFENLIRARQRLLLVIPLALLIIFGLIYVTYQNMVDAVRVFFAVPFACVGGVIALWLRDMPFSISAAVGFIALSGVAVLDDMILVSYVRQLREKGLPIVDAVREGSLTRLRPVLMTTLVASLGFVPMALSTGMGAEVQRPLATVVIGGVVSAMVMSLTVGRMLYLVFDGFAQRAFWVLHRVLGIPVLVLNPVFGFHRANGVEQSEGVEPQPQRAAAAGSTHGTEKVQV